jgi:hypothetical protein
MFEQSTPAVLFKHQSQASETGMFAIHLRARTRLFPALPLLYRSFYEQDNFILLLSVSPG